MGQPLRPKVGHIQFVNCLPLYYGLVKSLALLDIELIKGTPTELNNMLINKDLDVSPISSIEYARHTDSLLLFPDFTVSSNGEVKSILLLSRFPVEQLSGRKIALTSTSATSQALLKIILKRGYKIDPHYIIMQPDLNGMLSSADAALLIGDIALRHHADSNKYHVYDLGVEWKKLTGKNMVYAVWAVNRTFAEAKMQLCDNVYQTFRKSMDYSMQNLPEIVEYAAKWEPFNPEFLTAYFRSLNFTFGEEYQDGLIHFYRMAKDIGEIENIPSLEFIRPRSFITI
jgi:chorismate dehydratase